MVFHPNLPQHLIVDPSPYTPGKALRRTAAPWRNGEVRKLAPLETAKACSIFWLKYINCILKNVNGYLNHINYIRS